MPETGGRTGVREGVASHVVGFIGHNYLMNPANLLSAVDMAGASPHPKATFVLACESEPYFGSLLEREGITRPVMTHELMAPEAYVLLALLEGLGMGEATPVTGAGFNE